VIQSIVFWLAAGVGVIFLVLFALAGFVIRAVSNFIQKEE
jgi:Na+-transporting methylmalonyl-CoA/oxaloacetate decarboxylase gamma subunit